jgi:hypothetical protein
MTKMRLFVRSFGIVIFLLVPALCWGQNANSSISGQVTDPSGAVIPGAQLKLTTIETGVTANAVSGPDGLYAFQNLLRGTYELSVSSKGFRDFTQRGISLNLNQAVRLDVKLDLGAAVQTVEVNANASPLNYENAAVKQAITPNQIETLPLLMSGMKRNVVNFALLMPGVTTGSSNSALNARANGGLLEGDESTLDGVSMQEGLMSQSGMVTYYDAPIAPEVVDEVSIVASTYEPQYGNTLSSVYVVSTKAGTNEFHGAAYEFDRNTAFNARPFGTGDRGIDNENDYGAVIGGPAKIPKVLWDAHRKTYFFVGFGGFRAVGTVTKPVYSFPTAQERHGDFSDYPYPIYDPATTAPLNPGLPLSTTNVTRQQFMGCNGNTPNVICPSDPRLTASLAHFWLDNLPATNRPGLLNNYEAPLAVITSWQNQNRWDIRVDHYIGSNDHISITEHWGVIPPKYATSLPQIITNDSIRNKDHYHSPRANWDHTISPSLLNHFALGYFNWFDANYLFSDCCIDKMPKIPGVMNHDHQSQVTFDQYQGMANNASSGGTRPGYVANDMLTWIHGKHTLKVGAELRSISVPNWNFSNETGTFNFTKLNTGLPNITSGNDMASFELGIVGNASAAFHTVNSLHPQDITFAAYAGDTWKVNSKLSVNYGVRWDYYPPDYEKENRFSFFNPNGVNTEAGGMLGTIAFAGSGRGPASYGKRFPENTYYKGFAPRIGIAYSLSPKTVVRTGYGIFFDQNFYQDWAGGIGIDGFNTNVTESSTLGGLTPSFLLVNGLPQNFTRPPNLTAGADNGLSVGLTEYRPFDANRLPYAQQWNVTVEHQFSENFYISTAYVANKGTRLPSAEAPLNALNPSLLSMGSKLFDQFGPNDTVLDGVRAPYTGWASQMTGCVPTVAQALLPYPEFCGNLYGQNENAGNSTYHSFQFKAERRFSHGTSLLASYTNEKTLGSSDFTHAAWYGQGVSPFQRKRNKALANDDVPQTLSIAAQYELPFGKGQRFLNKGGPIGKIIEGWEVTSILRLSSGVPLQFSNGSCNLPGQFAMACRPATGSSPLAQTGSFDSTKPLLNLSSFEPTGQLSTGYYAGSGSRISNLRGFGFYNHDFGLMKEVLFTERVRLQLRGEFFNVWNWHTFTNNITTDVSSSSFGLWNGAVSNPRNIQLGMKIIF